MVSSTSQKMFSVKQNENTLTTGFYQTIKEFTLIIDDGKVTEKRASQLGANVEPGDEVDKGHPPPPEYSEKDPLKLETEGNEYSDNEWASDDESDSDETGQNWSDLDFCGKLKRIVIGWIGKFLVLICLLYFFICSLSFLSSAFRLLGGKTCGAVFRESELLSNPVTGLMIGILSTVLVQSSSTSTSIVVTMVASGILDVRPAIPIIMGANIGTSVTNTFVSMAQSSDRKEFKRAFAGATVHDMFNWLTVAVLLPVEVATGYLERLSSSIISISNLSTFKGGKQDLLKVITKPFTNLIIKVDKKVIAGIASGDESSLNASLLKTHCKFLEIVEVVNKTEMRNISTIVDNVELFTMTEVTREVNQTRKIPLERCSTLFSQLDLGDTNTGIILLILSLIMVCGCLVLLVKLLHSMMQGPIAKTIKKKINSDLPGVFRHFTGYLAILVGAIMTILVQSSSVFTSTLTPLVGMGLVKLERMYPLTLGSNIGTTMTGVLAALAAPGDKMGVALQIALCHLFFNITGIILFYPVPVLRRLPLRAARFLGSTTSKYRWFAMIYLILMFVMLPVTVFALSFAGTIVFIAVGSSVLVIVCFVIIVNIMQSKCPQYLPKVMHSWKFLPQCLRSLEPYDKIISKFISKVTRCCPCSKNIPRSKNGELVSACNSCELSSSLESSPAPSTTNSTVALTLYEKCPSKAIQL